MGFEPDLDDQLVSFGSLRVETVGLVIWPVSFPDMTYNVLSGTLSLYATTLLVYCC